MALLSGLSAYKKEQAAGRHYMQSTLKEMGSEGMIADL